MSDTVLKHSSGRALGKKPASFDKRDALWAQFAGAVTLPTLPPHFGHAHAVQDWGMLGNDSAGDCVWAGSDHEEMLLAKLGNSPVSFTSENALSDYSAVTGYDPADPSTDQGTDMRTALLYRQSTGVVDANGNRRKIGAFVALEPGNWHQLLEALYIFGTASIGFQCPSNLFDQFDQGVWQLVPGQADLQIVGGHYVPAVGTPKPGVIRVVSWGRLQEMTRGYYELLCDEAYAVLTEEQIQSAHAEQVLHGFDVDALKAYLGQL